MKSEIKKLDNSIVEITIEEKKEFVAKYRKQGLDYLRKNADIKWFRKWGNIPDEILVKQFGDEYINSIAVENAIDVLYKKALRENKIMPMAQAHVKNVESQDPLKFVIEVEVYPEVEIKKADYDKIEIKKTAVKVTAKEVTEALNSIQAKFTTFEEVKSKAYKAKKGDRVNIDTEGFDWKGKALENTNMQKYPLVLGSNVLVPGFEDGIAGHKTGEEFELDVTFPKDYHNSDFAGLDTKFKVKINSIEKAVKPEFTPEFIEQLRGKKLDLDGFKDLIKQEIKDTKTANSRMQDEEKLIEALIKKAKISLWENMIAGSIEKVFWEIKQNMMQQGAKMEDYLASLNMDEATYKEKHVRETAIKRLQGELILQKIQEEEKVEVTDKELEKEIETIIENYSNEEVKGRLRELYIPGTKYYEEIKNRMTYKKLIDKFIK